MLKTVEFAVLSPAYVGVDSPVVFPLGVEVVHKKIDRRKLPEVIASRISRATATKAARKKITTVVRDNDGNVVSSFSHIIRVNGQVARKLGRKSFQLCRLKGVIQSKGNRKNPQQRVAGKRGEAGFMWTEER